MSKELLKSKIFVIVLVFLLTACTYSIVLVHTEGSATDVVDSEQTPKTDIKPEITIPTSVIP